MPPLLARMTCTIDIVPALIKMKYEDHDFLLWKGIVDDPYKSLPLITRDPIEHIL